jgi:hypothetical protein
MDDGARFMCSVCARLAGTVQLRDDDGQAWVRRASFTSVLSRGLSRSDAQALRAALDALDALALYRLDRELAPFYCPECAVSYCDRHWERWNVFDDDGWHVSIRGRCPNGHTRTLED